MIPLSMLFSVGCSDTSLWDAGDPPPVRHTGLEFGQDTAAGESGGTGDTGGEGPWRGHWAELERDGDAVEGVTGFLDWDGAAVRCEIELPVTGTLGAGCEGCAVGAELVYGAAQVLVDADGACGSLGWGGLSGTSASFGHAAPAALWMLGPNGWSEVGDSAVTAASWSFERPL